MAAKGRPGERSRACPACHAPSHLEESPHPGIRQLDFLFKAPARIFGFHFETTSLNAESGLAAGTQFIERGPQPSVKSTFVSLSHFAFVSNSPGWR